MKTKSISPPFATKVLGVFLYNLTFAIDRVRVESMCLNQPFHIHRIIPDRILRTHLHARDEDVGQGGAPDVPHKPREGDAYVTPRGQNLIHVPSLAGPHSNEEIVHSSFVELLG